MHGLMREGRRKPVLYSTISLAFNLPFTEAINALRARRVVLPDDYYMMPAIARRDTFMITGLTGAGQVESVKQKIADILQAGGSFADFKAHAATFKWGATPELLETIYRNAVQRAYADGAWQRFERSKAQRPYLMYSAVNDSRTRDAHRLLSGIIRPVDDVFWHSHSPPLGHRCRCRLLALTEAEAKARSVGENQGLNKKVTPEMRADGEGWGIKPMQRGAVLERLVQHKTAQAGPVLGAALERYLAGAAVDNVGMNSVHDTAVRQALASAAFESFFNAAPDAPSRFAVASLTADDQALFGVRGDTLWLSRKSLDEHLGKHPEITTDDYRAIPDIVRDGQVWGGHLHQRYLILWLGGKPYRAAIKADAQGEEAWFLSLVTSTKQKPPKGAVRLR